MKIALIGKPGAGKGTRAKYLAKQFNIANISAGELLRNNIKEKTQFAKEIKSFIDKGKFVSDKLITKILHNRLKNNDCKNGFILDGFPRNLKQAKNMVKVDHILFFDCDNTTIIDRLHNRLTCKTCYSTFNLKGPLPKKKGKCDECHGELIQRKDDNEKVIPERLAIYEKQTAPVISFFGKKITTFDTSKEIKESVKEISLFLKKKKQ